MKKITINVVDASEIGSLYPTYDIEADILEVQTKVQTKWQNGIDIDGTIIFDADDKFTLVNFDLLIGRKYWEKIDNFPGLSKELIKGNIQFTKESIQQKSFNLPIKVFTNLNKSKLIVSFGELENSTKIVSLSEKCYAYISSNNALTGFYLLL